MCRNMKNKFMQRYCIIEVSYSIIYELNTLHYVKNFRLNFIVNSRGCIARWVIHT